MKERIAILMCLLGIFLSTTCLNGKDRMLTKYNCVTAGSIEELSDILARSTLHIKPSINRNIVKNKTQEEFKIGWLKSSGNIRQEPDFTAEIVYTLPFGEKIEYLSYNDKWNFVKRGEDLQYVWKELVSENPPEYVYFNTPYNNFKSYMSFRSITNKTSKQYKLQENAYTGNYGIRMVGSRYCIAVGSAYTTEIGTYIDLLLENGTVIPCILADCKADVDTDNNNILTKDGSLAEFVVDDSKIDKTVMLKGDISFTCGEWDSPVIGIKIYTEKENV